MVVVRGRMRGIMKRRTLLQTIPVVGAIPASVWASLLEKRGGMPQTSTTVYELRVYHANPGKLDDLLKRFREHTMKLFERHGLKNVAYWVPVDEPAKSNTLIYILEHPSREAAVANWKAFQDDPEWKSVRDKSEENGKLVDHVDSTYMALTDFSSKVG
jgi:NIPSNAP